MIICRIRDGLTCIVFLSHYFFPEQGNAFHPYEFAAFDAGIFHGRAEIRFTTNNAVGNACLSQYHGSLPDRQRFIDTYLSPKDHIVFDLNCTGHTNLGGDQAVLSNGGIMTNMHQVIQFGTGPEDGIMGNASVDGTVRSDLHGVVNDHMAATFLPFIMDITVGFFIVIESIAADHGTGLHHHIISQDTMVQDSNVGMNDTVLPDPYLVADKGTGHDHASFTNHR